MFTVDDLQQYKKYIKFPFYSTNSIQIATKIFMHMLKVEENRKGTNSNVARVNISVHPT